MYEKIIENKIIVLIGLIFILLFSITIFGYYYLKKDDNTAERIIVENTSSNKKDIKLVVDVKGEVKNPGVYFLDDESIINDAINVAGGFTKDAYSKNINLSKLLTSEQVIYVFSKKEHASLNKTLSVVNEATVCEEKTIYIDRCINEGKSVITTPVKPAGENNSGSSTNTNDISGENAPTDNSEEEFEEENKIININTAGVEQLILLDGIGEKKAEDIIAYRYKNGPFKTIDEIKNVSGIGEKTFEKIKDYITV